MNYTYLTMGDLAGDLDKILKDKRFENIREEIKRNISENYRFVLNYIIGFMIENKELASIKRQDMSIRISALLEGYNVFYPLIYKLSDIQRIPEEKDSMTYKDFAGGCSNVDFKDVYERAQIAIVTLDHGPATALGDAVGLASYLDLIVIDKTLKLTESQKATLRGILKEYESILKRGNDLAAECYAQRDNKDIDFALMAKWRADLRELVFSAKMEKALLEKMFGTFENLTGKLKEYSEKALKGAENTVSVLENRLRFAEGEPLQEEICLNNMLKSSMVKLYGPYMVFNITSNNNIYIAGDIKSLENAIKNIIVNGIYWARYKHEKNAEVSITLSVDEDKAIIKIYNNGPIIKAEDLAKIFDFDFTTRPSGTGTGLAETRRAINDHKGSISVECGVEEGVTFIIELPILRQGAIIEQGKVPETAI